MVEALRYSQPQNLDELVAKTEMPRCEAFTELQNEATFRAERESTGVVYWLAGDVRHEHEEGPDDS
jgi:hypothetical protein